MIERVNFQHFGDRSYAGNRFFRELPNPESQRSGQFAVEVNGTAAHASHYARVFRLGADQSDQDYVALGAVGIAQNAQDFDLHGLGLGALKDGVRGASHAFMNLIERHDFGDGVVFRCGPDRGRDTQEGGE